MTLTEARTYLYKRIKNEGFFYTENKVWLAPDGSEAVWTFDLKALLLDKQFLAAACKVFWSLYNENDPIQICGLESASVPLVTALVMSGKKANGLYVRKSRKKKYDLRELEGKLNDAPIVIVDDVVNSGSSIEKQIQVLKKFKRDGSAVFAFVHIQPLNRYEYLHSAYGITADFIFSVTDFGQNYDHPYEPTVCFTDKWKYIIESQHTFNVERRSQTFITNDTVYINADDGYVHALSLKSGDLYWKERVQKKVPLFSNQPGLTCWKDEVVVATENGSLIKLSARDGSTKLKKSVADKLWGEVLYEPEYGLFVTGRQGRCSFLGLFNESFAAEWKLEIQSKITGYKMISNLVVVTTDVGELIALHASNGKVKWRRNLGAAIFDGIGCDKSGNGYVVTESGRLQKFKLSIGKVVKEAKLDTSFFHVRCVAAADRLFLATLHRTLYCLDIHSLKILWEFNTRGRIFCRPVVDGDVVYFGNNECVLYALDVNSGRQLGTKMVDERIVSEPAMLNDGGVIISTITNAAYKFYIERPQ